MGMDKDSNLVMLICVIATIGAALAMRYMIEKPALKIRNKILNKLKTADSRLRA
jgi:peptidoglycan/LPS O-acetylase OafA/YrhL